MSFFHGANNFVIQESRFEILNVEGGQSGIASLQDASQPEATHDSLARHPAPKCYPGTREKYVSDIIEWANASPDAPTSAIYRMRGAAGVGKTAVAQTCAEILKKSNQLGVSFFFSVNRRGDHNRFFPSLAYQLSTQFPEYSRLVNQTMHRDKTLVVKNMASQFESLIVQPLRDLQSQGTHLETRIVLVDGLDECQDKAAQREIIEIVAASVHAHTTPFRWIFFSRPESHIEAIFANANIAPLCFTVTLPVTRESDHEIELYIRGGFEIILRDRNISLPAHSPWPSNDDVRILVRACAGLFIYAATVLRFIEHYPSLELDEPLQIILAAISTTQRSSSAAKPRNTLISPFVELDAFYNLIMQRIPQSTLPSLRLLLAAMFFSGFADDSFWSVVHLSNAIGFSEINVRSICNQVSAVLCFHDIPWQVTPPEKTTDLSRSFEHASVKDVRRLRGGKLCGPVISFYHRSFCDYLADPSRSGTFCITRLETQAELFKTCLQRHRHFEESFRVQGTDLILAPGIATSAASLSWPYPDHTNEFANSFFKARAFNQVAIILFRLIDENALDQRLLTEYSTVDHRKRVLNRAAIYSKGSFTSLVYGCTGLMEVVQGTTFRYIPPDEFRTHFNIVAFRELLKQFTEPKLLRPYLPTFLSRCNYMLQSIMQKEENSGLYVYGEGSTTSFWYFEINSEQNFYLEFETCRLADAQKIYRENGLKIFG